MKNFMDKIQRFVMTSVVLRSLRNGVMAMMPLIICGALFNIIASLPNILPFLPAYSEDVKNFLTFPNTFLSGILSIAGVSGITYYHAKARKTNQLFSVIIAIAAFLLVTNSMTTGAIIETTHLGASGLFTGIIVSIVSVEILAVFEKHNIKFNLPDTVPPAVTAPFEHMISGGAVLLLFYILNTVCIHTAGVIIPDLVTKILSPFFVASSSYLFFALILVFVSFAWFFGIHGYNCIAGIVLPIMLANLSANAELVAAGETPTNIYTLSLYLMAGNIYWFIPLMFMRCKSEQLKSVGKIALIPSIFNISEPITFGAPLVGNITLLIPNIIYQIYILTVLVLSTKFGFMSATFAYPGMVIPHPFFGYIATHDWRCFIVFAVCLIGSYFIWLPFVRKYDKQLVAEEQASLENKA